MVAHEKRNSGQLFCTVPTRNDLALSSLLFSAQPTQKLGYPQFALQRREQGGHIHVLAGEHLEGTGRLVEQQVDAGLPCGKPF